MEDNYKNIVQRNQFETPKGYSFKNSHKTQGNEINITQNRYEAFSDSDENDTKECNNGNDELSSNVRTSISSWQVNLGNNDIKKDQHKHKSKTKKINEKGRSVTVVVGDSIVKKVKGWKLSTKDDLFVLRSFPGAKTGDMESYFKPTLKNKPERIIIHCGTNDLKGSTPQSIAENILSLAKSSQQENNTVLVSSIVPRNDHLDKKGKEVNIVLKKRCNELNLAYISPGNIRTRYHCNYDCLHLNDEGATLFTENILLALNKVA